MKDSRIKQLLVGLALLWALAGCGAAMAAQPTTVPAHGTPKAGWELFGTYCIECHNADDWAGGVAFDTMTEADIGENIDVMEKVVRKLRSQQMPPGGHDMPDKPKSPKRNVARRQTTLRCLVHPQKSIVLICKARDQDAACARGRRCRYGDAGEDG